MKKASKPKLTFFGHRLARVTKPKADLHEEASAGFNLLGEHCHVNVYDRKYGATVATFYMGFAFTDVIQINGAHSCEAGLRELELRVLQRFKMVGELADYDVED